MMTDKSKSHDVFDGEIPKDLGKKKNPPLWVKLILLVILVAVLGTAAYLLESDDDYEVEPGTDLTETVVSELIIEDSNTSKDSITNIIVEDNLRILIVRFKSSRLMPTNRVLANQPLLMKQRILMIN